MHVGQNHKLCTVRSKAQSVASIIESRYNDNVHVELAIIIIIMQACFS